MYSQQWNIRMQVYGCKFNIFSTPILNQCEQNVQNTIKFGKQTILKAMKYKERISIRLAFVVLKPRNLTSRTKYVTRAPAVASEIGCTKRVSQTGEDRVAPELNLLSPGQRCSTSVQQARSAVRQQPPYEKQTERVVVESSQHYNLYQHLIRSSVTATTNERES